MIIKLAKSHSWQFASKLERLPNYYYLRPVKNALTELHEAATRVINSPSQVKKFRMEELKTVQQKLKTHLDKLGPQHKFAVQEVLKGNRKDTYYL